jgi:ketosteroid isomerase-like protein
MRQTFMRPVRSELTGEVEGVAGAPHVLSPAGDPVLTALGIEVEGARLTHLADVAMALELAQLRAGSRTRRRRCPEERRSQIERPHARGVYIASEAGGRIRQEVLVSLLAAVLLVAQQGPAPAPSISPQARPEIAAEVERGRRAYNAQDLAYYQSALAPEAFYIADDGAVFAGKERVLQLFTRIFARAQKPHLEIADVVTGGQGDSAWARFNWTLSEIERARPGVATVLFQRSGGAWQVVSIQNTAKGHAMRTASPAPGASPSPSPTPHAH